MPHPIYRMQITGVTEALGGGRMELFKGRRALTWVWHNLVIDGESRVKENTHIHTHAHTRAHTHFILSKVASGIRVILGLVSE